MNTIPNIKLVDDRLEGKISLPICAITDFYNHTSRLNEVDWSMVSQRYWSNTEDDFDRMRRKHAEFLVKDHVPVDCITGIVTYNADAQTIIENIVSKLALGISIKINPNNNFYY